MSKKKNNSEYVAHPDNGVMQSNGHINAKNENPPEGKIKPIDAVFLRIYMPTMKKKLKNVKVDWDTNRAKKIGYISHLFNKYVLEKKKAGQSNYDVRHQDPYTAIIQAVIAFFKGIIDAIKKHKPVDKAFQDIAGDVEAATNGSTNPDGTIKDKYLHPPVASGGLSIFGKKGTIAGISGGGIFGILILLLILFIIYRSTKS